MRSSSVSAGAVAVSADSCTADCESSCVVLPDEASSEDVFSVDWCCVSGKPLLSRTGAPLSVPAGLPMVTEYEYDGFEDTLLRGRSPARMSLVRVASLVWKLSILIATSQRADTFHDAAPIVCWPHGRQRHAGDGRADAQASFVSVALVRTQHRRGFLRQPSGGPAGHGTRPGVQDTGGSGGQWAHGRCRTDDRATRHQSVGSSRLRQEGKAGRRGDQPTCHWIRAGRYLAVRATQPRSE